MRIEFKCHALQTFSKLREQSKLEVCLHTGGDRRWDEHEASHDHLQVFFIW